MVWMWRRTPRLYWRRTAFLAAACCCCGVSATAAPPLPSAGFASLDVGVIAPPLPGAGDALVVRVEEEPVSCESGVEELECDSDVVVVVASGPPDSDLLLDGPDGCSVFELRARSASIEESGAVELEGVTVGALTVASFAPPSTA